MPVTCTWTRECFKLNVKNGWKCEERRQREKGTATTAAQKIEGIDDIGNSIRKRGIRKCSAQNSFF